MKWPKSLIFIRHAESEYNYTRKIKNKSITYKKFQQLFDASYHKITLNDIVKKKWPSKKLKKLAFKVCKQQELFVTSSDYQTCISANGRLQSRETGKNLHKFLQEHNLQMPNIVYISPYVRTRQTLNEIIAISPELSSHMRDNNIRIIEEERIREQEHGAVTAYSDWRLFFVFNPVHALHYQKEGEYAEYLYRFPNGENQSDVRDRMRSFMATLIREHSGDNILVVSHHLALLAFRANLERWDVDKFIEFNTHDIPINCGLTLFEGDPGTGKDGRFLLKEYNKVLY